jgi:hypothetical protein
MAQSSDTYGVAVNLWRFQLITVFSYHNSMLSRGGVIFFKLCWQAVKDVKHELENEKPEGKDTS